MLLHETEKYEEAIGTLEEAIERYPHDPQRLVAQYVIGESYRRWAQELLERRTDNRAPAASATKRMQLATQAAEHRAQALRGSAAHHHASRRTTSTATR